MKIFFEIYQEISKKSRKNLSKIWKNLRTICNICLNISKYFPKKKNYFFSKISKKKSYALLGGGKGNQTESNAAGV